MTTVLPEAGRHLQRDAGEPVVVDRVGILQPLAPVGCRGIAARRLREEDGGLGGFPLAEQDAVLPCLVSPIAQQPTRGGGRPRVVRRRQSSTARRRALMRSFSATFSRVRDSRSSWRGGWLLFALPFLGGGIGMYDWEGRRPGRMVPVGPLGPISKYRLGMSYGPLRTGSANDSVTLAPWGSVACHRRAARPLRCRRGAFARKDR